MKIKFLPIALVLLLHTAFSQTVPQPVQLQPGSRPRVIVFVHGLHGSPESFRASNGAYWPDLVRTDPRFAYSDVDVAAYPTPSSNGAMSSVQLADILYTRLKQDHVWEHREVVFLAHSLGGILVEQMLLRHPAEAAHVKFIVSYGTPHEGSPLARIASIYDRDPLLGDLSDASDNAFLTHLEDDWRAHDSVNNIHRFCAYESKDTSPDSVFGRYLRTHARVVSYFSATYGCDVTTPPQEIQTDHINLIRPPDRKSIAYNFFYRVYHSNPVLQDQVVTRENIVGGFVTHCDKTNSNADLQVAIPLDPAMHEKVLSASATWIDMVDARDVEPPTVTRIDPTGIAHIQYSFTGPRRKLVVCVNTARASLKVDFSIDQQIPLREPQN